MLLAPAVVQSSAGEKLHVLVALGQFVVDHAVGMRSNSVGNRFAVYFHGASPAVLVDPDSSPTRACGLPLEFGQFGFLALSVNESGLRPVRPVAGVRISTVGHDQVKILGSLGFWL